MGSSGRARVIELHVTSASISPARMAASVETIMSDGNVMIPKHRVLGVTVFNTSEWKTVYTWIRESALISEITGSCARIHEGLKNSGASMFRFQ